MPRPPIFSPFPHPAPLPSLMAPPPPPVARNPSGENGPPPLERLGQLARVVRRQHPGGGRGGGDRAEPRDRPLPLGQHLEQQGLRLHLDPVHLVDQQDHGLGRADRREQWPGEQKVLREDVLLDLVPVSLRSEEHTSELQSLAYLVCRLLLEKKKKN